jgi:2-hydroxychromene-2-carboxylate isomerase
MARTVEYWFSTASPWAWLGSARVAQLAARTQTVVQVEPIDLGAVFAATGGTPFTSRSPARQSYRQLELARWSRRLGVPIRLQPAHYPVDREPSSRLILAAREHGLDALALSQAVLRAIWSEDRDIADWGTLQDIARDAGLDGAALIESARDPRIHARYVQNTQAAIAAGVFGSPTYVVGGERFWGQDRLDFLEERLGGRP